MDADDHPNTDKVQTRRNQTDIQDLSKKDYFNFAGLPVELQVKILEYVQHYSPKYNLDGRTQSSTTIANFGICSRFGYNLVMATPSIRDGLPAWPRDLEDARNDIRYHGSDPAQTVDQAAQLRLFPLSSRRRYIHPDDHADLSAVQRQVAATGGSRADPHNLDSACQLIRSGQVRSLEQALSKHWIRRPNDGSVHAEDLAKLQIELDEFTRRANERIDE